MKGNKKRNEIYTTFPLSHKNISKHQQKSATRKSENEKDFLIFSIWAATENWKISRIKTFFYWNVLSIIFVQNCFSWKPRKRFHCITVSIKRGGNKNMKLLFLSDMLFFSKVPPSEPWRDGWTWKPHCNYYTDVVLMQYTSGSSCWVIKTKIMLKA